MRKPRLVKVGEDTYEVPAFIARVSFRDTNGWQVRYQGTLLFSDQKCGGRAQALQCACDELARRLRETPYVAPVRVQTSAIAGKQNDLPAGISGPILRTRKKGCSYWDYQVTFPLRGGGTRHTCVYVGTEKNITQQRLDDALTKAVRLRDEGVAASGRPVKLKSISQGGSDAE